MFHVAAAVTPWPPTESTPSPARLPGPKFVCKECCSPLANHFSQRSLGKNVAPQPSGTAKKNKKMLKPINHETHGTHEMDAD